jgi:hypothetical protein
MKKNFLTTLGVLLLGCGICMGQSEGPSLAELARQNKTAHKAAKIFTEADLPRASASAAESGPAVTAAHTANATTSSTVVSADKKDNGKETVPSTKAAQLKKQVESSQQERDVWKNSAKRYEDLLANETNDFRRQMYQEAAENDKKNAALYQGKADQAQSELVDLQKTARSASPGAPAGAVSQP